MKYMVVRICCCFFITVALVGKIYSQPSFTSAKTSGLANKLEDTLRKQFAAKKLNWPLKAMYLRSFKFDKEIEVWVKDDEKGPYKLFKTYKVCQQSGRMGPKRMEGDYQVPEGFYHINEFNPNSNYHLSLGLNYPNASDKILSDSVRPGTAIYIHGNCVSVGCIPVTDTYIEEIYFLGGKARNAGQEFIPVHIFPVRYNVKKSADYLAQACKTDASLTAFSARLKQVFDFFEEKKQLPLILVNSKGEYVFN